VFVAEAAKDLGGGVPLLGRGGSVVGADLVDGRPEGTELGRGAVAGRGDGLGMLGGLPDGEPGGPEFRAICRMDVPSRRALRMAP
jgi:hypothetical protein